MPRPIVLVATTDPVMAYALQSKLGEPCRKRGLKLEICPGGEVDKNSGFDTPAYDCAEALFDELESRTPLSLADTLVVLDVGAGLNNAFDPHASTGSDRWHVTSHRAGVAAELILRFPQVFPVILSPAVPVENDSKGEAQNAVIKPFCPITSEGNWSGFHRLQEALYSDVSHGEQALLVPLHFVSPLDGGAGLLSILTRFAHGMRCWFDPTGLRTLVKNRYLGTVFGSKSDWGNTKSPRSVLNQRLRDVAVAVDEEREFAAFSAYAAWKYGRRAWMVTSFAEFEDHPLWRDALTRNTAHPTDTPPSSLVLRDIDLRFPDVGEKKCKGSENSFREDAKSINSECWKGKLGKNTRVRAISGEANVKKNRYDFCPEQMRLGENTEANGTLLYIGLGKPVGSIYEYKHLLTDSNSPKTVLATLPKPGNDTSSDGHAAPYSNLAMAEFMIQRSRCCHTGPQDYIIGALLASEAYELLLGMSQTTALEALTEMHRAEIRLEMAFPGARCSLRIKNRKKDLEATTKRLFSNQRKARNTFIGQFWAELRSLYMQGEQFIAAEEANLESHVYMTILRKPALKRMMVAPMIKLRWLLCAIFLLWLGVFFYITSPARSAIQKH